MRIQNNFEKLLNSSKNKKILVIGDLMLDRYILGSVDRISPEAPVPVILIEKETLTPGGAGNVASNITALGSKAYILGIVGKDDTAKQLIKELKKRDIDTSCIINTKSRPTTQKIRVVANGQQLIRLDIENTEKIDTKFEKLVIGLMVKKIKDSDALIISDYAKGFITKNLAGKIISLSKKYKKKVIGDIKPKNSSHFRNIDVITPNEKEALEMSKKNSASEAGKFLQKNLNCNVLITMGAKGLMLFEKNISYNFPAQSKEVFSVTGAGDTVTAVFTLCLTAGITLQNAAVIANCAAGIVVSKMGTVVPKLSELENCLKTKKED